MSLCNTKPIRFQGAMNQSRFLKTHAALIRSIVVSLLLPLLISPLGQILLNMSGILWVLNWGIGNGEGYIGF